MYCPKCGTENPDDGKSCHSCGQDLTSISSSAPVAGAKTSTLAIVALVLGILSIALTFLTGIPAIICGIVALVKIKQSCGRLKGKGLAILGIAIPVVCLPLSLILLIHLRRQALDIKQRYQFHSIEIALTAFRNDYGYYPPSNALDEDDKHYCGAFKLCEAMFGQDLMGFHPDSRFNRDGTGGSGQPLYSPATLDARRRPYLELASANVFRLQDVYKDVGPFDGNSFVICDVYTKKRHSDKKTGMPILYYRSNTSNITMEASEPMNKRIYNAEDNLELIRLGSPGNGRTHKLADDDGEFFYDKGYKVIDPRITTISWPYRSDSFILISAGKDGLYGTEDDVTNFGE